jgi:hypothetical protein
MVPAWASESSAPKIGALESGGDVAAAPEGTQAIAPRYVSMPKPPFGVSPEWQATQRRSTIGATSTS